jgi:hypothetical protein
VRLFFSFLFLFVCPIFFVDKTDIVDSVHVLPLKPAWLLAFLLSKKTKPYFSDVQFQANQH